MSSPNFVKGHGVIWTFRRGCDDPKDRSDMCTEDTHWITCYTFCEGDFCNHGDGIPQTTPKPPSTNRPLSGGQSHVIFQGLWLMMMLVHCLLVGRGWKS